MGKWVNANLRIFFCHPPTSVLCPFATAQKQHLYTSELNSEDPTFPLEKLADCHRAVV